MADEDRDPVSCQFETDCRPEQIPLNTTGVYAIHNTLYDYAIYVS